MDIKKSIIKLWFNIKEEISFLNGITKSIFEGMKPKAKEPVSEDPPERTWGDWNINKRNVIDRDYRRTEYDDWRLNVQPHLNGNVESVPLYIEDILVGWKIQNVSNNIT